MRKVLTCCLLFVVSLAITKVVQAQEMRRYADTHVEIALTYAPASICKECHLDVYKEWAGSRHRGSFTDNVEGFASYINSFETDPAKKARVEKSGMKAEMMKCFTCHAPDLELASEQLMGEIISDIKTAVNRDTYSGKIALKKLEWFNVSCYICHNLKSIPPVEGLADPALVYSLSFEGRTPFHKTEKREYLDKAAFCSQCHGVATDLDGERLLCSTVADSYKDEYVAAGGKETCQDCHMRQADRKHRTPGSDSPDMLKAGIGLNLKAHPLQGEKAADITVELINNAGHRIPGRGMGAAKVVLELTAKDQQGNVVWSASKEFFKPKEGKDNSLTIGKTTETFHAALGNATGPVELAADVSYVHVKGNKKTPVHSAKQTIEP